MLRVSSVHPGVVYRTFFVANKPSPALHRVFFSSVKRSKESTTKNERHFEIVRGEVYPIADKIDFKKMSVAVRQSFEKARELANSDEIAIDGPPSDTLEGLLSMRMKRKKT